MQRTSWIGLGLKPRKHLGRRVLGRAGDAGHQAIGRVGEERRISKVDQGEVWRAAVVASPAAVAVPLVCETRDHEVLWLHVAVDDPERVKRSQGLEQLVKHRARHLDRQRAVLSKVVKKLDAAHPFHAEPDGIGRADHLKEGDNVLGAQRDAERGHLRMEHRDKLLVHVGRIHPLEGDRLGGARCAHRGAWAHRAVGGVHF